MRHKYHTRAIVLSRSSLGEANTLVTLLTADLGLVRARAQGLRHSGAKLSSSLATFAESEVVLVHGKEGWRVAGALLAENWFVRLGEFESRTRAARVSSLVLRLVAGETHDAELFATLTAFFDALTALPVEEHESAEILAALRVLAALGLDTGGVPQGEGAFASSSLRTIARERSRYISRINRGLVASGL